jgi:hypothetical protein
MFEEHYPESSPMYPQLIHYINNRDDILKSFKMKDHGIAKALFPILMYGGSIQTWEREFEINSNDYELPPFVALFHTEMKILTAIILNNPLFKTVSQSFRNYKKLEAEKKHYAPFFTIRKANSQKMRRSLTKRLSMFMMGRSSLLLSKRKSGSYWWKR